MNTKRHTSRNLVAQFGGFKWLPSNLIGILPTNSLLILTELLDLENQHGQGFFHSYPQLIKKFGLDKKTIMAEIKYLRNTKIIYTETDKKTNKNKFYIVEDILIKWLEDPHAELAKMIKENELGSPKLGTTGGSPDFGTGGSPDFGTAKKESSITRETEHIYSKLVPRSLNSYNPSSPNFIPKSVPADFNFQSLSYDQQMDYLLGDLFEN
jgi:hypothetical protein